MESNTKKNKNRGKTGENTPPIGKRFNNGQSGNPNGRPKKYITQITEATGYKLSQIQDCIKSMLTLNSVELKKIGESITAPALELLIAKGINGDLKRGELKNLETLLGRSFGKAKEVLEVTDTRDKDKLEAEILQKINERRRNNNGLSA